MGATGLPSWWVLQITTWSVCLAPRASKYAWGLFSSLFGLQGRETNIFWGPEGKSTPSSPASGEVAGTVV